MKRAVFILALLATAPAASAQPPTGLVIATKQGAALYAANCAVCHGANGVGTSTMGPPLRGVGAGTADFYLRTGYMPLGDPHDQPERRTPFFNDVQIKAVVRYVASLGSGPSIPQPHPERGNLSEGMQLFTEHCAGCHQIAARGGVATGARIPPLTDATAVQIAEAVRTGPYVMPRFSQKAISRAQLDSIVRYVEYAKHPSEAGGWGIGFIGPVPEGMVAWLLAAAALVAVCVVIGRRLTE